RKPLLQQLTFGISIPNQLWLGGKLAHHCHGAVFFVDYEVELQVTVHFFSFFIVKNKLSSWLKRASHILRNCSSHLSIAFIFSALSVYVISRPSWLPSTRSHSCSICICLEIVGLATSKFLAMAP